MSSYTEFVEKERGTKPSKGEIETVASELVDAIKKDYTQARLPPKDRAMLDLTRKLAVARRELSEADFESLRHVGFSEHEILDIVLVASLAEFANCLAEATGMKAGESLQRILFGGA